LGSGGGVPAIGCGLGLVRVAPPIVALLECTIPLILLTGVKLGTARELRLGVITRSEMEIAIYSH